MDVAYCCHHVRYAHNTLQSYSRKQGDQEENIPDRDIVTKELVPRWDLLECLLEVTGGASRFNSFHIKYTFKKDKYTWLLDLLFNITHLNSIRSPIQSYWCLRTWSISIVYKGGMCRNQEELQQVVLKRHFQWIGMPENWGPPQRS